MNLAQIRQQIDKIDNEILNLLLKRIQYSELVAKIKLVKGSQIYDKAREQAILNKTKINSGKNYRYVLPIFLEILNSSKVVQQEIRNNPEKN